MEKQISNKKKIMLLAIVLAVLLFLVILIAVMVGTKNKDEAADAYENPYPTTTMVGYNAEYLGTVARNIPAETKDEGLIANGTITAYPTYGKNLSTTKEESAAIVAEANYLNTYTVYKCDAGTYEKMDKDGYLYRADGTPVLDSAGNQRQLYKHTASAGMYLGDVSDDEPGIIKRITLEPRGYYSYSVTGVYAPAGEVITIQISEADMKANGGFTVYVGQTFYSGYMNGLGAGTSLSRMPLTSNTFEINTRTATLEDGVYTAYVGSYLGGPIYIGDTSETITVTISGGVRYSHYILGYTTAEEFAENAASSAPYFDLEVRNYGVLHSGPKKYAEAFSYDDLYKAAVLWEKITLVSTQGVNQGVSILYDTYIPNGYAAISFVGWRTTVLPGSWMGNALNYKSFSQSGGWGTIHEYNHHFQHYGVGFSGASDEITNNALNVVEYSQFTAVSSARGMGSYGSENLSDWNTYTSATWSLETVIANNLDARTSGGLAFYSTLLHNLGADNFMQAKVVQQAKYGNNANYETYLDALTQVTHNNMSYYFNTIMGFGLSDELFDTYTDSSYPMFVPVSSVYQTGRSYTYDGEKKYIQTMQPYKIPYGQDFTVDLSQYTTSAGVNQGVSGSYVSGSVVLPDGFSYKIKSITNPASGKLTKVSDYVYTYTPGSSTKSGKIYVTLEITKDDGAFKVDDVDLVLEFAQSHEVTKNVLEKTVYNYTENFYDSEAGTFTTTAAQAYESNFEGAVSVTSGDNINPTNDNGKVIQDCNAEVWTTKALQDDTSVDENVKTQVIMISGKLYVDDTGKYRISLRGRMNVALYLSTDGGSTYTKAVDVIFTNSRNTAYPTDQENGYVDLDLEADSWVYFRAVMVRYYGEPSNAHMGVGWGKWTEETEDTPASVTVGCVKAAYRNSYVSVTEEFTSDYLYTRQYKYSYIGITNSDVKQELIEENCQFSEGWGHALGNLVDGDNSTYMHTDYEPTEDRPVVLEVKLASETTANRLIFDGSHNSESSFLPKAYQIWVSSDGEEWTLVCTETESTLSEDNWQVTALFDGTYTFSYYKIKITATHKQYIALRRIILQNYVIVVDDGNQLSPDDDTLTYYENWSVETVYSSFGHVYLGQAGATMKFTFEGTRFGIISTDQFGTDFKVEIDGKEVSSIELVEYSKIGASYVSELLSEGKHTVKITCLSASNIDSIVVW